MRGLCAAAGGRNEALLSSLKLNSNRDRKGPSGLILACVLWPVAAQSWRPTDTAAGTARSGLGQDRRKFFHGARRTTTTAMLAEASMSFVVTAFMRFGCSRAAGPDESGQSEQTPFVSAFFRRSTLSDTVYGHAHHRTGQTGHPYQGRFTSFSVQGDEHLLVVT